MYSHLISAEFLCITSAQSLATEPEVNKGIGDETPIIARSVEAPATSTDKAYGG